MVCTVVRYLSDEWMERASAAFAEDSRLSEATADADLLIQYEVTGGPEGKRQYGLRIAGGSVTIEQGAHPDAPVSFALTYSTAAAIARGELSAQAAFMQGDLKLGGDVTVLVRQHALIGALEDALGGLRAETEY
jgi:putative sterol carrier protein